MSGWSIIDEREAAPEPTPINVARAELLGVRAAPYGRRVLATVIDLVPAWLFCIPLFFVPGAIAAPEGPNVLLLIAGAAALLVLTLYGLLQLISHGRRGQTFGKQMMRLRTVRATTFRPIGFARALGRAAIVGGSGLVPVIGTALLYCSALWDRESRGRAWHDHAVDAWMIDLREVDPTDPVAFENARGRARVRSVGMTAAEKPLAPAATPAPSAWSPAAPAPQPTAPPSPPILASAPPVARPSGTLPRVADPTSRPDAAPQPAPRPAPQPQPQPPPQPRPEPAAPTVHVRFDDGAGVAVTGRTLVGRRPDPEGGATVVAIDDDTRSVSKTHLVLDVDAQGLVVTDRGSTNGSALVRGERSVPLEPSRPVRALRGDRIRFGDRHLDVV